MKLNSEKEIGRLYYSIGEVASMLGVNTSLIRFWEKEFDIIRPHRNKKGNRLFTRQDVDNFRLIYHLVKEKGYTLAGAKERLRANKKEVETEVEILKTLRNIKTFLLQLRQNLSDFEKHTNAPEGV